MALVNTDLLLRRSNINTSPNIKTIDTEKSLFTETLDMLAENDEMLNEYLYDIKAKVAISEAGDNVILNEFNVKDLGRNIIRLFIDAIKATFVAFKNAILKITASNKTIDKYMDKIKSIKEPFNTTFERYIYTCSDPLIPDISLKTEFDEIYDALLEKLDTLSDITNSTERIARMESIQADIDAELTPAYYESLRARILGNPNNCRFISEDMYSDALFNVFRDGGELTSTKVTPTEISNIINRYTHSKQLVNDVEKTQSRIIQDARKVEKYLDGITLEGINKYYKAYDVHEEAIFRKIISSKFGQIKDICNMYTLAFGAKLDALKDSEIQDRKVLIEAAQFYNVSKYT